jgi:hypothetical protein
MMNQSNKNDYDKALEKFNKLTWLPPENKNKCLHSKCEPEFDEKACENLSAAEVQHRYPRFDGICPDCGEHLIMYKNTLHYLMGDY